MEENNRFDVIIAGTRRFKNYELLRDKCDLLFSLRKPTSILCGEARGADTLGKQYARERGIDVISFPADWSKYGKRAGFIRNESMVSKADALVAFWDGKSNGTRHAIECARRKGIPYRIIIVEC